ncbi:Stk1 family PASTA domain-containing Ser/Thr kinase [Ethanoligenens harbinense]|nr:Stk1 family PASTA domain-containing Ser/Thr kinase [Ethanoligenens harbinense]
MKRMENMIGRKLDGRYAIQEVIGVGGMAIVYKAYDEIDDRVVAVKVLKDEYLSNEDFKRRFKNESKAIAMLSHPNIVKVYDVSLDERLQYIVMEYVDGITLKEYIDQQHVLTWKEAVHFTVQILRALQHAHEKGIVHRDIKPQNIMMLEDGTIKVADFGIARMANSETRTMTDKAIGSVHYISPEQASGSRTDEKSDIYSLGVMLYEMLTGKLPFDSENAVSVAIMQMQTDPRRPRELNPDIPEGLEEITLRAMQKEPARRYVSAAAMLADINAFKQNPSIHFAYKYFVDDSPTRYYDAVKKVRGEPEPEKQPEVAPKKEAAKKNKSYISLLSKIAIVFILIAAVIIGIMMYVFGIFPHSATPDVKVPNLVGQQYDTVVQQYGKELQIVKSNTQYDNTAPAGQILSQNPKANADVKKNAQVSVVVSLGPKQVTVPDVTNLAQADAVAQLTANGLQYTIQSINDDSVAKGSVVKTDPVAGTQVNSGSSVTLYISLGPVVVNETVPNVVGMTQDAAKTALENAGLKLGNVTQQSSSTVAAGTVISQDQKANTQIPQNTAVNLVVSSGTPSAPNVVGESISKATSDLQNNGYSLGNVTYANNSTVAQGDVISQQTESDNKHVDLVVSLGPATSSVSSTSSTASTSSTSSTTTSTTTTTTNTYHSSRGRK